MITWHDEFTFDFTEVMTDRHFTEDAIFFDIETTGFSPARSDLYLIGCATRKGSLLCIDQFFAESKNDEAEIIHAFFSLLRQYRTIISFNGIGFDIPYLKGKCKSLKIASPFEEHSYLDIYKEVTKMKALLGLVSLKQKSIEIFLGIDRKDLFSGGELIEVYKSYVRHPSDEALALLKQHNYEDVLYMPKLLPILSYREALNSPLTVLSLEASESSAYDGHSRNRELIFTLESPYSVPKPISYRSEDCYLMFRHSDIRLCIRLFDGELRFFFDNPKDYYYLINEDMAVLKSLAAGVNSKYRKQATASNCYTKKHALFLPQHEKLFQPAFCHHPKDRKTYFELSEEFIASSEIQETYVNHFISHINTKKGPVTP